MVLKCQVKVLFYNLLVLYSHEPARLGEGDLRNGGRQARQGSGNGGVDVEGTFYLADWTTENVLIHQSVPLPERTWYAGLVEDLALDDVDGLQGEYCAVQVKRLDMSALFCSHLKEAFIMYIRRLMVSLLVWIALTGRQGNLG